MSAYARAVKRYSAESAERNGRPEHHNVQRIEAGEIDVLLRTTVGIRKAFGNGSTEAGDQDLGANPHPRVESLYPNVIQ